jgi:hypothetical protein
LKIVSCHYSRFEQVDGIIDSRDQKSPWPP